MDQALSVSASSLAAPRARVELPALTSMRFFAALHVVFYHYLSPLLEGSSWLARLASHGYVGVSFFFLLSGFVLTHVYGDTAFDEGPTRHAFWRKRLARIYPIYFVAFLLYAPSVITHRLQDGSLTSWAKLAVSSLVNVLLLQAWVPGLSSAWNSPSWSISAEAFFYLLFPWLGARLCRVPSPRLALLVVWLLALLVPLVALRVGLAPPTLSARAAAAGPYLRLNPLLHLPAFAFGVLLYRAQRDQVAPAWSFPVSLVLTVCVLLIAPAHTRLAIHNGGLLPLFGVMILAACSAPSLWTRLLHTPAFRFLGDASYALYVLQAPLWVLASSKLSVLGPKLGLVAYLALLLLASAFAHSCIEQPARRWLTARTTRLGGPA